MANNISIKIDQQNSELLPGEALTGKIIWSLPNQIKKIELRLFWFTEGRGTQDIELIDKLHWDSSSQSEAPFEFSLPTIPYSFSGKLISLQWALEAVSLPNESTVTRQIFTLSPNGKELILSPQENTQTADKKRWRKKR